MTDPIRHESSDRNRRKLETHIQNLIEELESISGQLIKLKAHVEYALGRVHRINNRWQAEKVAVKEPADAQ